MSLSEIPPEPPELTHPEPLAATPIKPQMPASWRWMLRITGTLGMLLFLTPTFFVIKYYMADRPREAARAQQISLTRLAPTASLNSIAPPLQPTTSGNAAFYYTKAIQSFANRAYLAQQEGKTVPVPSDAEAALLFEGARRIDCRFFVSDKNGQSAFTFHDPERGGAAEPYRYPITAEEPGHYLGAAVGLAQAAANVPQDLGGSDPGPQRLVAQAIIRFGDALGREGATRTHLEFAKDVQRVGLRMMLPTGGPKLKQYVYSLVTYDNAVQAKYALLEPNNPENIVLQERVAQQDSDPLWRREAVWALAATIAAPHVIWTHPMETLTAKATLADIASHDVDSSVRAAADAMLRQIAQHGAVFQR